MIIILPPMPNFREWPYSHEELRARDTEVARCVLEAAAKVCEHWSKQNHVYVNGALRCGEAIRNLEISHD